MPLHSPVQIRDLIQRGRTEQAINELRAVADHLVDRELRNTVTLQSARWAKIEEDQNLGLEEPSSVQRRINQLNAALLSILDDLPHYGSQPLEPPVAITPGSPVPPAEPSRPVSPPAGGGGQQPAVSEPRPSPAVPPAGSQSGHQRTAVIMGGIALLLVFGAVLWKPDPSESQYLVFRIMLALGAAGVAAAIPGFLNVNYKNIISAGGALAVFVVVLFFTNDPDSDAPFGLTVFVHGPNGRQDVILEDGALRLDVGEERKEYEIGNNGRTVFSGIPGQYRNAPVSIGLQAPGYEVAHPDTLYRLRPGEPIYLEIKLVQQDSVE